MAISDIFKKYNITSQVNRPPVPDSMQKPEWMKTTIETRPPKPANLPELVSSVFGTLKMGVTEPKKFAELASTSQTPFGRKLFDFVSPESESATGKKIGVGLQATAGLATDLLSPVIFRTGESVANLTTELARSFLKSSPVGAFMMFDDSIDKNIDEAKKELNEKLSGLNTINQEDWDILKEVRYGVRKKSDFDWSDKKTWTKDNIKVALEDTVWDMALRAPVYSQAGKVFENPAEATVGSMFPKDLSRFGNITKKVASGIAGETASSIGIYAPLRIAETGERGTEVLPEEITSGTIGRFTVGAIFDGINRGIGSMSEATLKTLSKALKEEGGFLRYGVEPDGAEQLTKETMVLIDDVVRNPSKENKSVWESIKKLLPEDVVSTVDAMIKEEGGYFDPNAKVGGTLENAQQANRTDTQGTVGKLINEVETIMKKSESGDYNQQDYNRLLEIKPELDKAGQGGQIDYPMKIYKAELDKVAQAPVSDVRSRTILGGYADESKIDAQRADFAKMKEYPFKYKVGDKVETPNGVEIVRDFYIQDGQPKYTTYPPGKKQSYAYHTWSYEKDLQPVVSKKITKSKTPQQIADEFPEFNTFEGSLAISKKVSSIQNGLRVTDLNPRKVKGTDNIVEVSYKNNTGRGYGLVGAIDNLLSNIANNKLGIKPKTSDELSIMSRRNTVGDIIKESTSQPQAPVSDIKPQVADMMPNDAQKIIDEGKKDIGTIKEKDKRSIRDIARDFYTNYVNRFAPLERLTKEIEAETQTKILPELSPEYTTKRLLGAGGIADYRHKTQLKPIFDDIEKMGIDKSDFDLYLKAMREIGFGETGRDIKGIDVDRSLKQKQAIESKYSNVDIEGIANRLYEYQDNGLRKLVEAGFITKEQYQNIKDQNKNYVPFERVQDEIDNYLGVPTVKGQQGTSPLKKIKGSDKAIISPLETILANTYKIESAVAKNNVAQSIVGLRNVAPEYKDMFSETSKSGNDTITVWENGQKKYYQVGEEIANVIKGLNEESANTIIKILSAPAKLLRQGATGRNIDFMIPNVFKDQFDAAITSKYGYKPFVDYLRGLGHLINYDRNGSDEIVERWLKSGGAIYFDELSGRKDISQQMSKQQSKNILKQLWEWGTGGIETVGRYSETPTRLGLFMRGLEATGREEIAAAESREGTLDFARMGAKMRSANSIIPFLNVGVQGFDKTVRTAKENPAKFLMKATVYAGIPALTTTLWNYMTNPEAYKEIADYEKETNFIIVTGRDEEGRPQYIKIPKGNVAPLIANPTEHFIGYLYDQDSQNFGEMAMTLLTDTLPVVSGGKDITEVTSRTIGSNLPQAVKPLAENIANYNFFYGNEIVPSYLKGKEPSEQVRSGTEQVYRTVGELFDVSPLKVKNITEGYLSSYAKLPVNIVEIFDSISKGEQVNKDDIPVLRRFLNEGLTPEVYEKVTGNNTQTVNDLLTRQPVNRTPIVRNNVTRGVFTR